MRLLPAAVAVLLAGAAQAQPAPALRLEVTGPPVSAVSGVRPGCGAPDMPDAPARAVCLATGEVQLYATSSFKLSDRDSIASPWTPDGRTIWAVAHDHGRRPALYASRQPVGCWHALTAVSHDGGQTFQRMPGRALVAALPFRDGQPERGDRLNLSNIVTLSGAQYMFAFAAQDRAQRPGNCLLRTAALGTPGAWRGGDGSAFGTAFVDSHAQPVQPEAHGCAPVEVDRLRWPVAGLVRHAGSGLFIAMKAAHRHSRERLRFVQPEASAGTGPRCFVASHKSSVVAASIRPAPRAHSESTAICPWISTGQDQLLINRKNQIELELTNS